MVVGWRIRAPYKLVSEGENKRMSYSISCHIKEVWPMSFGHTSPVGQRTDDSVNFVDKISKILVD